MPATTFSVIVTCHNYRDYVVEAVDSALAQTRAPAQVIVVDDGSSDGSAELLRQRYAADGRVTLVCVPNGGQLSAFQQGLAHAQGDVICFLDADDRWSAEHIERVGAVFDARRDIDFVFCDVQLFGNEQGTLGYADRALDFGCTVISTYVQAHWYGAPTSALALRAAWARRALDLPPALLADWRLSADNCLVFGAGVLGARKLYLPTGSVHYRIHGSNSWWGRQSAQTRYLNKFRSRCLIELYAQRIGLGERCLDDVVDEYRTKPDPSWRETRRYARLVMRRRAPWPANLARAIGILAARALRRGRATER